MSTPAVTSQPVTSQPGTSQPVTSQDGRHLRRDRNREAVVDALLELYREGSLDPSSAEIAERAGLSPRSLFRYFDDVDDLCQAAIAEQQRRVLPVTVIDARPDQPLDLRIEVLVAQRIAVFEAMGPAGTVSRLRAPFQPLVATELAQARALFRAQIKRLFAPELASMGDAIAATAMACADVLCSFEAYQLLCFDQGLTRAEAGDVLVDSLGLLFADRPNPSRTNDKDPAR